jgi:hypothetical protein
MTEPGDYLPEHCSQSCIVGGGHLTRPETLVGGQAEGAFCNKRSTGSGPFIGALVGVVVALFINTVTNFGSNYLTRRDQHVQEADKCNDLASSLFTTASFARDAAQAASDSIAAPPLANGNANRFVLPAIDEILHGQDRSMDIIDPNSRNIVLQLEAYYRAIRDDLSNTPDVIHQGETFLLLPASPNKGFYEKLLGQIALEAQAATHSLSTSRFCDDLAKTEMLWPSIRKHDHLSAQ